MDSTALHQNKTNPLKEAMESPLVEEEIRGEIDVIATHIVHEVVDIACIKAKRWLIQPSIYVNRWLIQP